MLNALIWTVSTFPWRYGSPEVTRVFFFKVHIPLPASAYWVRQGRTWKDMVLVHCSACLWLGPLCCAVKPHDALESPSSCAPQLSDPAPRFGGPGWSLWFLRFPGPTDGGRNTDQITLSVSSSSGKLCYRYSANLSVFLVINFFHIYLNKFIGK